MTDQVNIYCISQFGITVCMYLPEWQRRQNNSDMPVYTLYKTHPDIYYCENVSHLKRSDHTWTHRDHAIINNFNRIYVIVVCLSGLRLICVSGKCQFVFNELRNDTSSLKIVFYRGSSQWPCTYFLLLKKHLTLVNADNGHWKLNEKQTCLPSFFVCPVHVPPHCPAPPVPNWREILEEQQVFPVCFGITVCDFSLTSQAALWYCGIIVSCGWQPFC